MPPPDILQLSTCLDDLSNSGFWVQCSPLMDGHFCQRIWQPLKTFPLHRAMENTRARVSSYSRWPKSFLSSWKYWLKFCCVPLSLEESNKIMSYKYKKITVFSKDKLLRNLLCCELQNWSLKLTPWLLIYLSKPPVVMAGRRPAMTTGWPKADPGWLFKKMKMGSDREWVINSNKHI